jgi:hypothetical protein
MVAITTRAGKGAPLTNAELDANFTNLNGGLPPPASLGDVFGPAAATDNAVVRYDGISGKLLQDSLVLVGDTGTLTVPSWMSANRVLTKIDVLFTTAAGVSRHQLTQTGGETGGNAGSNLSLQLFDDAGTFLSTAFTIIRADSSVNFGGSLLAAGMVRAGPQARVALEQTGENGDVVFDTGGNYRFRVEWATGLLTYVAGGVGKLTITPAGTLYAASELQAGGYIRGQGLVTKSEIIYTDAGGIARHAIRQSPSALFDNPTPLAGEAGQELHFIVYTDAGAEGGTPLRIDRVGGGSVNITTLNVSGPATFGAGVNAASLVIRAGPMIHATAGGVTRWSFEFLGGPQNWSLNRFNDAGVWQGSALIVDRATGDVTVAAEITFGTGADKVEPRGRYYRINALSAVASYGFLLADQGSLVRIDWGAPIIATIPTDAAQAFPIGARIDVVQWGTGQLSIAPDVGVTLQSAGGKRKFTGPFSGASLTKIAANYWLLVGDLTA